MGANVTGIDVIDLRRALGISVAAFAAVFGVSISTVYRWETRGIGVIPIESLQSALLVATRALVAKGGGAEIGKELELALVLRGSLYAFYALLRRIYALEPVQPTPQDAP